MKKLLIGAAAAEAAAFLDQPPSQSFEAASLQLKTFELGIGMAEQIFVCGNHRASPR